MFTCWLTEYRNRCIYKQNQYNPLVNKIMSHLNQKNYGIESNNCNVKDEMPLIGIPNRKKFLDMGSYLYEPSLYENISI